MATGIHSVGNPPEEIGGFRPVAATDIYMFGSILYFIFSGGQFPPLPLTKEEYILDIGTLNLQTPPKLIQLVRMMTQYEPADRIPTMDAVVQQINVILAEIEKNPMSDTYFNPNEAQPSTYIDKKE
jgi:hypothetical protein